jgi:signal transduction histidine kinase
VNDACSSPPRDYEEILAEYIRTHSEESLYRVSLLSQQLIESGLGPEDIIALHFESLDRVVAGQPYRERTRVITESQQFLLEVMISYGVRFKEYLELRLRESLRDAEARTAHERERAMDAERLGRQKAEILKVIAHELRTPIAAAQGNIDLAKRSLSREQLDRLPRLLDVARSAIDRLSRLSADLVEASRDELPALQPSDQNLTRLVALACAWAEPTADANQVTIVHETAGEDIQAACDGDAVLSILGNLLSNAVRYTPAGGQVTARCGHDGQWAWIEVRDTGIGMPSDVQAHIFDQFYRAPEARHLEARGLGLGLALVRRLVDGHGGRVEVESSPGQGSTFRVYLPLAKQGGEHSHG